MWISSFKQFNEICSCFERNSLCTDFFAWIFCEEVERPSVKELGADKLGLFVKTVLLYVAMNSRKERLNRSGVSKVIKQDSECSLWSVRKSIAVEHIFRYEAFLNAALVPPTTESSDGGIVSPKPQNLMTRNEISSSASEFVISWTVRFLTQSKSSA